MGAGGQSCQQTFPEVQWEELSGRSLRPWQCRVVSAKVPSRREGEGRWQEPSRGSQALRGDPHIIASALQGMDLFPPVLGLRLFPGTHSTAPHPGFSSLHPTQPQPTGRSGFPHQTLVSPDYQERHCCVQAMSRWENNRGAPCSLGTLTYKGMGLPRRGWGLEAGGQMQAKAGLGSELRHMHPFLLPSLCWPHSLRGPLWPRSQWLPPRLHS